MQAAQPMNLIKQVHASICKAMTTSRRKGNGAIVIDGPFIFEDCDMIHAIITPDDKGGGILTDEGYTLNHLGYYMDENALWKGNRASIVSDSALMFGVTLKDGVFTMEIPDLDNAGDYYFDFAQCLIRVSDITLLSRDIVKTTFIEDFKAGMTNLASKHGLQFNFDYKVPNDEQGLYKVDCIIETPKQPTYIFAVRSDDDCRDAAISIYRFDKWDIKFNSVAVHENASKIGKKASSMLMDAVDKEISGLDSMNRLEDYVASVLI
jgi:hypothetical protein